MFQLLILSSEIFLQFPMLLLSHCVAAIADSLHLLHRRGLKPRLKFECLNSTSPILNLLLLFLCISHIGCRVSIVITIYLYVRKLVSEDIRI